MNGNESSWPDEMDAAERVRHVALTRSKPHNAGWIAAEADVSRDAAVKHLSRLVDQEDLVTVETGEGTCYKPDTVTQFLDHVRELAEDHSLNELTTELHDIGEEIDAWKREYDVDSLTELRQSLGDNDLSSEQHQERSDAVEEWKYDIEMREAIRMAISLKESLTKLGADRESGSVLEDPQQQS